MDVHAASIVMVRMVDGATPQPPHTEAMDLHRFTRILRAEHLFGLAWLQITRQRAHSRLWGDFGMVLARGFGVALPVATTSQAGDFQSPLRATAGFSSTQLFARSARNKP